MAKLVLAAGVPHPPRLVYEMAESPGKMRGEALMKQVREQVEKAEPDLIIEVDSDHFVNFFYNNLPSFCIGMAEEAQGPQETWCPMPRYTVRGHVRLAKAIFRYGVHANFDLAAAHELRLDHSLVVPLHFLNPAMELPVIPIYTNGFASPLPLATRCFSLGRMLRRFIDAWEGKERGRIDRQRLLRHGRRRTAAGLDRQRLDGNDIRTAGERAVSGAGPPRYRRAHQSSRQQQRRAAQLDHRHRRGREDPAFVPRKR
jgi:hypothetical protein